MKFNEQKDLSVLWRAMKLLTTDWHKGGAIATLGPLYVIVDDKFSQLDRDFLVTVLENFGKDGTYQYSDGRGNHVVLRKYGQPEHLKELAEAHVWAHDKSLIEANKSIDAIVKVLNVSGETFGHVYELYSSSYMEFMGGCDMMERHWLANRLVHETTTGRIAGMHMPKHLFLGPDMLNFLRKGDQYLAAWEHYDMKSDNSLVVTDEMRKQLAAAMEPLGKQEDVVWLRSMKDVVQMVRWLYEQADVNLSNMLMERRKLWDLDHDVERAFEEKGY